MNENMNPNNMGQNNNYGMDNNSTNNQMPMNNMGMQNPAPMDNGMEMQNQQMMNQPMMNQQMPMNQQMGVPNQMPVNPGMGMPPQGPNNKPSGGAKIAIIVAILVLVIALVVVLVFVLGGSGDNNTGGSSSSKDKTTEKTNSGNSSNKKVDEETLNKNVTEKDYILDNENILVEIKNSNTVGVNVDVKIEFYDANKNIVNIENAFFYAVPAGATSYDMIYIFEDDEYDSYKVSLSVEQDRNRTYYNDKIELVSQNSNNGYIYAQFKNNADVKVDDIQIGALFYDSNNKIMAYSESYDTNGLAAGDTTSTQFRIPYDNNFDEINYSKVEFVIIYAITN